MKNPRIKTFALEITKAVDEVGTFEGYASVFNVVDSDNEKVMPGAFAGSLNERKRTGRPTKMLWQHHTWEPIGVWQDLAEDSKGLFAAGKLTLGVRQADEARLLLKDGALDGMSIGFRVIEAGPGEGNGAAFELRKLDLVEISLVTFPANPRARVDSVKSDETLGRLERFAKQFRDGENPSPKELEEILREVGFPKAAACAFVSRGYVQSFVRSESDDDAKAKQAIERVRNTLSSIVIPKI